MKQVKVRELIRIIESDGWKHVRTTGSHRHFKHSNKPNVVTIPDQCADRDKESHSEGGRIGEREMSLKYTVIFEKAEHNWAAYVPDLPGCMTTGRTLEDTEGNIREAIRGHLETLRAFGEPVPEPTSLARDVEVAPVV